MDSAVLWATPTWNLKYRDVDKLNRMELSMYRKVAQHIRFPGEDLWDYWQRTAVLYKRWCRNTGHLSLLEKAMQRKWRWAGHVARLIEQRLAY